MERGPLLFSTSGLAADEVPGLHCLSLHPVSASLSVHIYLCVLVDMYIDVCIGLCMSNIWPMPEYPCDNCNSPNEC